jgi:hypothetical protein
MFFFFFWGVGHRLELGSEFCYVMVLSGSCQKITVFFFLG